MVADQPPEPVPSRYTHQPLSARWRPIGAATAAAAVSMVASLTVATGLAHAQPSTPDAPPSPVTTTPSAPAAPPPTAPPPTSPLPTPAQLSEVTPTPAPPATSTQAPTTPAPSSAPPRQGPCPAGPANGRKVKPDKWKPTSNPNRQVVPGKMRSDCEEIPKGFSKQDADQAETMEAQLAVTPTTRTALAAAGCQVYWAAPYEVCGAIRDKYNELGGPNSFLLWPTTNRVGFVVGRRDRLRCNVIRADRQQSVRAGGEVVASSVGRSRGLHRPDSCGDITATVVAWFARHRARPHPTSGLKILHPAPAPGGGD